MDRCSGAATNVGNHPRFYRPPERRSRSPCSPVEQRRYPQRARRGFFVLATRFEPRGSPPRRCRSEDAPRQGIVNIIRITEDVEETISGAKKAGEEDKRKRHRTDRGLQTIPRRRSILEAAGVYPDQGYRSTDASREHLGIAISCVPPRAYHLTQEKREQIFNSGEKSLEIVLFFFTFPFFHLLARVYQTRLGSSRKTHTLTHVHAAILIDARGKQIPRAQSAREIERRPKASGRRFLGRHREEESWNFHLV